MRTVVSVMLFHSCEEKVQVVACTFVTVMMHDYPEITMACGFESLMTQATMQFPQIQSIQDDVNKFFILVEKFRQKQ